MIHVLSGGDGFGRSALLAGLTLAGMVGVSLAIPEHDDGGTLGRVSAKFAKIRKAQASMDETGEETAGYYEGLFAQSARMASANDLVAGRWDAGWTNREAAQLFPQHRRRGDFLHYELLPNIDVKEFGGRLVTNSRGMADREYTTERTPGVRRIALLGDSVARGLGSNPGANFESLLEADLDSRAASFGVQGFEILNFAVEGYRTTQMVEVAATKAAEFRPDAYILCVTDLSVFRKWGDHVGQLVHDGVDVKYPFLKDLVARSGLRPGDGRVTTDSKLAPFRLECLRWAVETVRDQARAAGGDLVVLLLPTVREPEIERAAFEGVREILDGAGVRTLDLLDTFAGVPDLAPYRISKGNVHPTDAGHRRLFETLRARIEADPAAARILTGTR